MPKATAAILICSLGFAASSAMAQALSTRDILSLNKFGKKVPSGMRLEFGLARSPGNMKVSFQAARSIG
ncbi:hypothetical protein [Bradyrhizobium sp.]|uniref:hypothetical protein n=1 Tax=Bradyrhizobium sp. TaxID=376 RepID=UPI00272CB170|nr:hypothetical protein [Bradyrhizobium sp.]